MHPNTKSSWHLSQCAKAKTFTDLSQVALTELEKFGPEGAWMICGPISTGGLGSVEKNLEVFNKVILYYKNDGLNIFDQVPYEEAIIRLRNEWRAKNPARKEEYCWPVLEEFYKPVFDSGKIIGGVFILGWESSQGATWEHEILERFDRQIRYITLLGLDTILNPK